MPGPTDDPFEWATDANHEAGGDAWSGQPNKVEPSAGMKADGFVPEQDAAAEWFNWLFNNIGQWATYLASFVNKTDDELKYPATKTRTVTISPESLAKGTAWVPNGSGSAIAFDQFLTEYYDLRGIVPTGAAITAVAVKLQPNGARPTSTDRFRLSVEKWTYDGFPGSTTPTQGGFSMASGFTTDDGTADNQVVTATIGGGGIVMDDDAVVQIGLRSGEDVLGQDVIYDIEITFTEDTVRTA